MDLDAGGGFRLQNKFSWSRNSGRFIGIFPGDDVSAAPAGTTIATGPDAGTAYTGNKFTAVIFNTKVDNAGLMVVDARIHTARNGYALDTFQIASEQLQMHYRELTTLIENGLPQAILSKEPLPEPGKRRLSRRVRSFPMVPRVTLTPDDKAQNWLLNISASDRAGLLYSVARILAAHGLSVQLAKVSTLGERVEDSFLVQGPRLNSNAQQLLIETQLVQMLQE